MTPANDLATCVAERTALSISRRLTFVGPGPTFIDADNTSRESGYPRLVCQAVVARVKDSSGTIDVPGCVPWQQQLSPDEAGRYTHAQRFKPPTSHSVRESGTQ